MSVLEKLETYARHNLNVMFIGAHGIGKTTMARQVAEKLGLKFKYYSSSTLDPWVDVVGVPKPNDVTKKLEFFIPEGMHDAEMILFDELNRAHPRVLNAVLEIIQFKSVNGVPFPNLKMVWAAINPAGGEYNVEQLDPALMDRFHVYLKLEAEFCMDYMRTKMKEETAKILRNWWTDDMNADQRKLFSPRRLEYVGFMIDNKIDWKEAMPEGVFPEGALRKRIKDSSVDNINLDITKDSIIKEPQKYVELIKKDPSAAIKISEVLQRLPAPEIFQLRDVFEVLPKDLLRSMGERKWDHVRRNLLKEFSAANIDPKIQYPRLWEGYGLAMESENKNETK